jgi:hypothetical protein
VRRRLTAFLLTFSLSAASILNSLGGFAINNSREFILQKLTLLVLISALLISSCTSNVMSKTPEIQAVTTTPENTLTPTPTINAELPASVYTSTTLEIIRQGKKYSILLGYDIGEAFMYATPRPDVNMPGWYDDTRNVSFADIKRYGDFDHDGENEYLVAVSGRGAKAYATILAIGYDKAKDEYKIFDEIDFYNSIRWDDIENDGVPEIIAKDESFVSRFSAAVFAPLKILHYDGNKFVAITQTYPDLIEKDVEHWLEMIDTDASGQGQFDSIYASYLADMYLLGKKDEGIKVFLELCDSRYIPYVKTYNPDSTLSCSEFLLQVQNRLKEYGYD